MSWPGKVSQRILLLMAFTGSAFSAAGAASCDGAGGAGANTARDGNIAIREEFEAALAKDSREALELFLARHPGHELSKDAEAKLEQLSQQGGRK